MKRLLYFVLALAALLPAKALAQDIEAKTDTIIDQPADQPADLTIDQPGRRYTMYGVMFYNLENLFDTINNNGVYDLEFSPQGARQWNGTKYWQKQHNMAYAISQMEVKGSPAEGPVIIGVSEIEASARVEGPPLPDCSP